MGAAYGIILLTVAVVAFVGGLWAGINWGKKIASKSKKGATGSTGSTGPSVSNTVTEDGYMIQSWGGG